MNRLNSIALLAGSALVAVAATGCASSAKPAAAAPAAGSSTTAAAPGTPTSSAPAAPSSSAPAGGNSSAPAGGSSTAPAANNSSTVANGGSSGGSNAAAPVSHPVCDNAKINASLWQDQGQPPTLAFIAVKNTGPTCLINPIPYLWIVKSPTDASDELRPLVPGGIDGTAKPLTFVSGTTMYSAVDLDPKSAPNSTTAYGYLEVTANPSKDTSGKDVQDVQLSTAMYVSNPKLGNYANNPSLALDALQYSTTPES